MPVSKDIQDRLTHVLEHLKAHRNEQARYAHSKIPKAALGEPEVMIISALMEFQFRNFQQALTLGRQAYLRQPDNSDIACHLAQMLFRTKQEQQALEHLSRHYQRHPNDPLVVQTLCDLFRLAGLTPQSNTMLARLIELRPDHPEALFMRAYNAVDLRDQDEALRCYAQAAERFPADRRCGEARLFAMLYSGAEPAEVRKVAEDWCRAAFGGVPAATVPPPAPLAGRKVRIGYVSADFRAHVVMYFFEGVLRHHDRSQFHVTCYSNVAAPDKVTQRVQSLSDAFYSIRNLTDDQVAELIRSHQIDVLVDLSGHTDGHRLGVFARRAAPVQATYLGYPATTGLPQMDFRITDGWADPVTPEGTFDAHCSESVYRLPRCAWAFELAPEESQGVERNPTAPFSFASFNLLAKVSRSSTQLWGKALAHSGPSARLLMTDRRGLLGNPTAVARLTDEFAATGVDVSRVSLASWLPTSFEQRARYREVDVMFDPLTYNGTTTTCEALWHGVPTLSLAPRGKSHVSRVGLSLLTAVGLGDFLAESEDDFLDKARLLAEGKFDLPGLRSGLRDRLRTSPLGDHLSLARALEDAYVDMLKQRYP